MWKLSSKLIELAKQASYAFQNKGVLKVSLLKCSNRGNFLISLPMESALIKLFWLKFRKIGRFGSAITHFDA